MEEASDSPFFKWYNHPIEKGFNAE
jgi:hypothetical protein